MTSSVNNSEFKKLADRVNGNDSLIDGLIIKVKKLNQNFDGNSKVKTPAFANNDSRDIDNRIKNLERIVNNSKKLESSSRPMKDNSVALDFDIENRIKLIEKELEDIKVTIPGNIAGSNDGTTHSSMNYNLRKKLDALTNDQIELKNNYRSCQQLIDAKVDFEQLQEIDKVVTDKLNDWIKAVKRQMQDKTESSKNLKKLEKQLRDLYDVLYNQASDYEEEEEMGEYSIFLFIHSVLISWLDDPGFKTMNIAKQKPPMSLYSRSPYDKKSLPKGSSLKYQSYK